MKNRLIKRQVKSNTGIKGKYTITKYKAGTKEVISSQEVDNLVVANTGNGTDLITRQLIGDDTYTLEIDSASIGTGTSDPSTADTGLETPVLADIARTKAVATPTSVTLDFFIPDATLANGSYSEFGLFCGDQLFARSIIAPAFTKSSGEDTAINYQITITTS